ncbi:MAG TPA: molybdenum cofactor guanylyltransferase [Terracidiphilus sp.]|nr:molybdenum cofactor guanylyltransferase [Terracidiphilus sp.]
MSYASASGFVLAGGASKRMGRDKALVEFAGEPLLARALRILQEAGLVARIAGARTELEQFARVINDAGPGRGPLAGICAALAACETQLAVFIPVDLPLLPASLVTVMVRRAEITDAAVTVPSVSGFAQTFPAVLDRTALPALEDALKQGSGGCFAAFEAAAAALGERVAVLPVEYLTQAGQVAHPHGLPPAIWFLNVNTPAELRRAEALSSRAVA